jgi:hypothetical protein
MKTTFKFNNSVKWVLSVVTMHFASSDGATAGLEVYRQDHPRNRINVIREASLRPPIDESSSLRRVDSSPSSELKWILV